MVGISSLYLGSFLVVMAIVLGLAAGVLRLLNGGFDVNAPTFSGSAVVAYGAYSLGIWVPGTLIFVWYMLARVALYHRITRTGRGPEVVGVFA